MKPIITGVLASIAALGLLSACGGDDVLSLPTNVTTETGDTLPTDITVPTDITLPGGITIPDITLPGGITSPITSGRRIRFPATSACRRSSSI